MIVLTISCEPSGGCSVSLSFLIIFVGIIAVLAIVRYQIDRVKKSKKALSFQDTDDRREGFSPEHMRSIFVIRFNTKRRILQRASFVGEETSREAIRNYSKLKIAKNYKCIRNKAQVNPFGEKNLSGAFNTRHYAWGTRSFYLLFAQCPRHSIFDILWCFSNTLCNRSGVMFRLSFCLCCEWLQKIESNP